MTSLKERARRLATGVAVVVGLALLAYAAVALRPNPVSSPRKAHERRGLELGMIRPETKAADSDPAFPPAYVPPPWETPGYDKWLLAEIGVLFKSDLRADQAFLDPIEEDGVWRAVRERCIVHPLLNDRCQKWGVPAPALPEWRNDPTEWEKRRAGIGKLMEAILAAEAEGESPASQTRFAVGPVIAYLALHGRHAEARMLLDKLLARELNDPWFFLGGRSGMVLEANPSPGAVPAGPYSTFDGDPIVSTALLLDAAGVEGSYLERMSEALEKEIPSAEQRQWLLDEQFFREIMWGDVHNATVVAKESINVFDELPGGHLIEEFLREAQRPILKASYRETMMAWRAGDFEEVRRTERRYRAVYEWMELSREPATDLPQSAVTAKWLRATMNPPARLERVELARFAVAALRYHRSEGRWPGGLDDLVPRWLAPGSVGADGARWGVEELPGYDVPIAAKGETIESLDPELLKGAAAEFRDRLAQDGTPPDSTPTASANTHHIAARPIFWRIGPADRMNPYFWKQMSSRAESDREVYDRELEANLGKWRAIEAHGPIEMPDPRALRLLAPEGS